MHRDLKLENILVNKKTEAYNKGSNLKISDFEFKIGDMGLAKSLNSKNDLNQTYAGTPLNMSPELINEGPYDQKADVWSLGIMVYHILTGERPFFGRNIEELKNKLDSGKFKIPSNMDFSLECIQFVTSCLKSDSGKRLDYNQLLEHPFLSTERAIKLGVRSSMELDIKQSVDLRIHFQNEIFRKIE